MKRTLADFANAMGGTLTGGDAAFSAISIDSRTCGAGDLFVALRGDRFDGHDFVESAASRGVVAVVVDRPCTVAVPQIVVSDTLVALQNAAAAWRNEFQIPVIGVAGSNGKTTTKEMIARIVSRRGSCLATKGTLNNHIGVPLTLLSIESTHDFAVIEIGANHPGEVAALTTLVQPTVAIVTNAGAEHLEGFGSLEGAARAEGELFAGLRSTATAVINADDEFSTLWMSMNRASTTIRFGMAPDADVRPIGPVTSSGVPGEKQSFSVGYADHQVRVELGLAGRHNVQNALGAAAAACAIGLSLDEVAAGLADVQAVKGRLQFKKAAAGGAVIDDSYNANPSSLNAGLDVLAQSTGDRWLVLGNMGELGAIEVSAHEEAAAAAHKAGVTRLFTLGDLAAIAARAFGAGAESFGDADALSARISPLVTAGVTVLVKGSRVNRLERVVDALINHTSERG